MSNQFSPILFVMKFHPIYPKLSLDVVSEDFALGYNQIGATTTTTAPRCASSPSSQAITYYQTTPPYCIYYHTILVLLGR